MSTSSATGFMEAAVRSGVRKRVLVVDGGFFGDRFARIAERSGKEVVRLPIPLGRTVEADELDQWLSKHQWTRWRWSTRKPAPGHLAPLEELARVVRAREDVVLLVDAVTSIGGSPVETDAWGLDFVFTGTQKALALPPGIALATASPRMMERAAAQGEPGWYFDLVLHDEAIRDDQPTQTPCIPLYLALDAQLRRIDAEGGVQARWARHHAMLRMMEEWVTAHPEFGLLRAGGTSRVDRLSAPGPRGNDRAEGGGAVCWSGDGPSGRASTQWPMR